jgi:hypothetical protein
VLRWTWKGRRLAAGAALAVAVLAAVALMRLQATTRQGVNYKVTEYSIPAHVKTIDFLQRHFQYQLLVSRICISPASEESCVLALFDWASQNIKPTPAGWPVIDDHPLHIAIRGYGESDQVADVFTTLATYAGVRAFFRVFSPQPGNRLVVSFAKIDARWVPFDVARHVVWRTPSGALASVDDLRREPAWIDALAAGPVNAVPYSRYLTHALLTPFVPPATSRGELQQPWPRLKYEVGRVFGFARE